MLNQRVPRQRRNGWHKDDWRMKELNTQTIIDYTYVPTGWLIKGHLWTGQPTVSTITCTRCGRVGVICSQRKGQQIIVHSGRVESGRLTGIDYSLFLQSIVTPQMQSHKQAARDVIEDTNPRRRDRY